MSDYYGDDPTLVHDDFEEDFDHHHPRRRRSRSVSPRPRDGYRRYSTASSVPREQSDRNSSKLQTIGKVAIGVGILAVVLQYWHSRKAAEQERERREHQRQKRRAFEKAKKQRRREEERREREWDEMDEPAGEMRRIGYVPSGADAGREGDERAKSTGRVDGTLSPSLKDTDEDRKRAKSRARRDSVADREEEDAYFERDRRAKSRAR